MTQFVSVNMRRHGIFFASFEHDKQKHLNRESSSVIIFFLFIGKTRTQTGYSWFINSFGLLKCRWNLFFGCSTVTVSQRNWTDSFFFLSTISIKSFGVDFYGGAEQYRLQCIPWFSIIFSVQPGQVNIW